MPSTHPAKMLAWSAGRVRWEREPDEVTRVDGAREVPPLAHNFGGGLMATGEGNYVAKLQKFMAEHPELTERGSFSLVDVRHDRWCGVFKGRRCNCDPDVSLKAVKEDA